jgi:hypothetical protein
MIELTEGRTVNVVFNGYHNGQRGSYTPQEGYFRYIRFEKEPFEVCVECRGRNCYLVYIGAFNGTDFVQIPWSNPTSLKKLRELFEKCKQSDDTFKKYLLSV